MRPDQGEASTAGNAHTARARGSDGHPNGVQARPDGSEPSAGGGGSQERRTAVSRPTRGALGLRRAAAGARRDTPRRTF